MSGKIDQLEKNKLLTYIKESNTLNSVLEKIGLSQQNTNRQKLRRKIEELKFDITHFERQEKKLTDKMFGFLKPIQRLSGSGKTLWKCECVCGKFCNIYEHKLLSGLAKSCGCQHFQSGSKNHFWKGYQEISGTFFDGLIRGARLRDLEYKLSREYIWNLFVKQNRKCALSGIELSFSDNFRSGVRTASLDRIDNSKGYIEGNVQWIHKDINRMKNIFGQDYFIDICKKIANNTRG
jgi:hypothetical protein